MKRSLKSKYHLLIAILFGMIALQTTILLFAVSQAKDLLSLASDIHSIVIIFVFGIFVYIVILYNYIPFKLHKAIADVQSLVERITGGNYQIDIDSSVYDQDKDFQSLIYALDKMLGIITRFDQAKAEKIYEHHQRIQMLINLLPQSILIIGANGDVVYCNEIIEFFCQVLYLNRGCHRNKILFAFSKLFSEISVLTGPFPAYRFVRWNSYRVMCSGFYASGPEE